MGRIFGAEIMLGMGRVDTSGVTSQMCVSDTHNGIEIKAMW